MKLNLFLQNCEIIEVFPVFFEPKKIIVFVCFEFFEIFVKMKFFFSFSNEFYVLFPCSRGNVANLTRPRPFFFAIHITNVPKRFLLPNS